jgi:hypothetical protein
METKPRADWFPEWLGEHQAAFPDADWELGSSDFLFRWLNAFDSQSVTEKEARAATARMLGEGIAEGVHWKQHLMLLLADVRNQRLSAAQSEPLPGHVDFDYNSPEAKALDDSVAAFNALPAPERAKIWKRVKRQRPELAPLAQRWPKFRAVFCAEEMAAQENRPARPPQKDTRRPAKAPSAPRPHSSPAGAHGEGEKATAGNGDDRDRTGNLWLAKRNSAGDASQSQPDGYSLNQAESENNRRLLEPKVSDRAPPDDS